MANELSTDTKAGPRTGRPLWRVGGRQMNRSRPDIMVRIILIGLAAAFATPFVASIYFCWRGMC